jgi:hypothetical protein
VYYSDRIAELELEQELVLGTPTRAPPTAGAPSSKIREKTTIAVSLDLGAPAAVAVAAAAAGEGSRPQRKRTAPQAGGSADSAPAAGAGGKGKRLKVGSVKVESVPIGASDTSPTSCSSNINSRSSRSKGTKKGVKEEEMGAAPGAVEAAVKKEGVKKKSRK